jgi:hypothetical protein
MVAKNFRYSSRLNEEELSVIEQPRLVNVEVERIDWKHYNNEFFGIEVDDDWPVYTVGDDSVLLNSVRLRMEKSNDSAYHVYRVRESRGSNRTKATNYAERIQFTPEVNDSTITLPQGFFIDKEDKFRNQRVIVVFEIPVGKRIRFHENISIYKWMDMRNNRNRYDDDWDDWNYVRTPEPGEEYIMKEDGKPQKIASF